MKTLTPAPLTYRAGLPAYCATPWLPFRLQPRGLPGHRFFHHASVSSDFRTSPCMSRLIAAPAESSSFSYGPTVRLRLLSTPPHGDAVTFGYGVVASSDTDFHRADVAPSRAHSCRHDSRHPGSQDTPATSMSAWIPALHAGMTNP